MDSLGGGAAEIRLYRRPSYGATLVQLAALEAVAPPRPVKVGSDPGVEEVDGELGHCPGLYLALVQDAKVIDVARLRTYAGEAATEEDEAEDYFLMGSDTSQEDWPATPTRGNSVWPYKSSSSEEHKSSSSEEHKSSSSSEECKSSSVTSSKERQHGKSSSGGMTDGHEEQADNDLSIWRGTISSEEEYSEDEERKSSSNSDDEERKKSSSSEECKSSSVTSSNEEQHGKSSSSGMKDGHEQADNDLSIWRGTISSEEYSEDEERKSSSHSEDEERKTSSSSEECKSSSVTSSNEEQHGKRSSGGMKDVHEQADNDLSIWSGTCSNEEEYTEDDNDGEDVDGNEEEGADRGSNKEGTGKEDSGEESDYEGRSLKLKLRIWLAKKHLRIKFFCGKNWISTKVYHLTWVDHKELEELFESSFKMDVGAPISTNTIFRIRDSSIDFEILMLDTPKFDDLLAEFKPSIGDFKICQKIGGEGDCRVFKCLYQGSKFALKTLCLTKSCNIEPFIREVEIISSLKDKRVMAFYQAWIEPWMYKKKPVSDYLFIQLELCESTLKDKLLIENFDSIVDRWFLFEELVKAVKIIHDELIVHRDLKPDNIFYGFDMGVRIGDFGDACTSPDEFGRYGGTPSLGTAQYAAPELDSSEKISEKVDIFPLGVMFLELFTKFVTVREKDELFKKLREKRIPDIWVGDLVGDREGARGLVERMIATEPASRPSAADILDFIQQ